MSTVNDINEFLEQIENTLEKRWLEYYEANQLWIVAAGLHKGRSFSNGGYSPSSDFILGVVAALEPRLAKLLPYLLKINGNQDNLINLLKLNIDPDSVIAERNLEALQVRQAEVVRFLPEPGVQDYNNQDYSAQDYNNQDYSVQDYSAQDYSAQSYSTPSYGTDTDADFSTSF